MHVDIKVNAMGPCFQKNNDLGKTEAYGASLVVQWLRRSAPSAGVLGSISGQGTRSHMLRLRVHMPRLKYPTSHN